MLHNHRDCHSVPVCLDAQYHTPSISNASAICCTACHAGASQYFWIALRQTLLSRHAAVRLDLETSEALSKRPSCNSHFLIFCVCRTIALYRDPTTCLLDG